MYDKSDIGAAKPLADGRGWHCAAGSNIGENPFQHFTWQKAVWALSDYNRGQYSGGALYIYSFCLLLFTLVMNLQVYICLHLF